METMYYIGLDVHKRTISYRVKDVSGKVYAEGKIPATRFDLASRTLALHNAKNMQEITDSGN